MKKIVLFLVLSLAGLCFLYDDSFSANLSGKSHAGLSSANAQNWNDDSAAVLSIISTIRNYRENEKDSDIQVKIKKKKMKEELSKINSQWSGKTISLKAVMIDNVTEEKELSEYGKRQKQELLSELKKDEQFSSLFGDNDEDSPMIAFAVALKLAFCSKCYTETGAYQVEGRILAPESKGLGDRFGIKDDSGSEKLIPVKIILLVRSEDKALGFNKNQVVPVSGKIKSVGYKGSLFSESVTLKIE